MKTTGKGKCAMARKRFEGGAGERGRFVLGPRREAPAQDDMPTYGDIPYWPEAGPATSVARSLSI